MCVRVCWAHFVLANNAIIFTNKNIKIYLSAQLSTHIHSYTPHTSVPYYVITLVNTWANWTYGLLFMMVVYLKQYFAGIWCGTFSLPVAVWRDGRIQYTHTVFGVQSFVVKAIHKWTNKQHTQRTKQPAVIRVFGMFVCVRAGVQQNKW